MWIVSNRNIFLSPMGAYKLNQVRQSAKAPSQCLLIIFGTAWDLFQLTGKQLLHIIRVLFGVNPLKLFKRR